VTILFLYFVGQTIYYSYITIVYGQVCLIFFTFFFAFIIDQAKSFVVLSLVYIVVVRRFGFLKENEKEWINKEISSEHKEVIIPKI
jgi:hypothetical protein